MAIVPEVHTPITPDLAGLAARRMRGAEWLCQGGPSPAPLSVAETTGPGFYVDFTGAEEVLEQFKAAAEKARLSPADSALDLIYLFCIGKLYIDEHP